MRLKTLTLFNTCLLAAVGIALAARPRPCSAIPRPTG